MDEQTFILPTHPYYPPNAHIPDYVANVSSVAELLVRFGTLLALSILPPLWLASRWNPRLTTSDQAITAWFILCEFSLPTLAC